MSPVPQHPDPTPGSPLLAPRFSRRGFLVRSAGLTALLAAGGCAGDQEQAYRALLPPGDEPAVLPVREYAVLRAVAGRLIPGGTGHPGAAELDAAARVDRELGFHPERLRDDLRDALRLVEWWPLGTRLSLFTRLGEAQQDAELAAMAASRWAVRRVVFQGIKSLVMFFHYTQRPAWQGIGYQGPWVPPGPERTWG